MLIAATHIENVFVVDQDSHHRLGVVRQTVFDSDRGTLKAVAVRTTGLIPTLRYLSFQDIITFESHAILCDENALCELEDLPRVQELIARRCSILNQAAETVSGKHLGRVVELMIDEGTGHITQYHTQSLRDKRIFLTGDVVEITPSAVKFRDDIAVVAEEAEVPAAETVAA